MTRETKLEWVRRTYAVPAYKGFPVKYKGVPGELTGGASGPYVAVKTDRVYSPLHPRDDRLEYLWQ